MKDKDTDADADADADFAQFLLRDCGYLDAKRIEDTHYTALVRFAFTVAIVLGEWGDRATILDRWCYTTLEAARAAWARWDGPHTAMREPEGWMRHPRSGRRVSLSADERGERGELVGAVGVLYVRH